MHYLYFRFKQIGAYLVWENYINNSTDRLFYCLGLLDEGIYFKNEVELVKGLEFYESGNVEKWIWFTIL